MGPVTPLFERGRPPFDRIPNELLSKIFILSKPPAPRVFQDPLPLGFLRVSKRWRFVATNTSKLWTVFQLGILDKTDLQLPTVVSGWLDRSNCHPIRFGMSMVTSPVDIFQLMGKEEYKALEKMTDALCAVSSRWQIVNVVSPSGLAEKIILAAENAASCKKLVVVEQPQTEPIAGLHLPFNLPDIPVIHIEGLGTYVKQKVNLTAIRDLYIDSIVYADACVNIIESAPNLEKLRLMFTEKREMYYEGEPVLAKKLVLMDFTFETWYDADLPEIVEPTHIFLKITAPSLTTFCLTDRGDAYENLSHARDFITRSKCALRRFYYRGSNDNSLLDILRLTPSIKVLDVRSTALLHGFEIFLSQLAEEQILPRLEDLVYELWETSCDAQLVSPLKAFAERRCRKNGGRLEKFAVLRCHTLQPAVQPISEAELFKELQGTGIKFSLESTEMWSNLCCQWD